MNKYQHIIEHQRTAWESHSNEIKDKFERESTNLDELRKSNDKSLSPSRNTLYDFNKNNNLNNLLDINRNSYDDNNENNNDINRKNRNDLNILRKEIDQFRSQIIMYQNYINKQDEEKEQLAIALHHSEGKLQFRQSQVLSYESEKEIQKRKENDILETNNKLEFEIKLLKKEIVDINIEFKANIDKTSIIERKLAELTTNEQNGSLLVQLANSNSNVLKLQQNIEDITKINEIELTRLKNRLKDVEEIKDNLILKNEILDTELIEKELKITNLSSEGRKLNQINDVMAKFIESHYKNEEENFNISKLISDELIVKAGHKTSDIQQHQQQSDEINGEFDDPESIYTTTNTINNDDKNILSPKCLNLTSPNSRIVPSSGVSVNRKSNTISPVKDNNPLISTKKTLLPPQFPLTLSKSIDQDNNSSIKMANKLLNSPVRTSFDSGNSNTQFPPRVSHLNVRYDNNSGNRSRTSSSSSIIDNSVGNRIRTNSFEISPNSSLINGRALKSESEIVYVMVNSEEEKTSSSKSPKRSKKNKVKKEKNSEKLEKSLDLSKDISKLNDNKTKILNQNSIKKRPSSAPTSSVRESMDNIKRITSINTNNIDKNIRVRDGVSIPSNTNTVKRSDFNSIDVVSNRKQTSISTNLSNTSNKTSVHGNNTIKKSNTGSNNINPKNYINIHEAKSKNIAPQKIPIVKIPMVKKDQF